MQAKINIADNGAIQANDNATLIVNNGNPNDTKVRFALKIEELEAEKQKWIDDELTKHGAMIKSVHQQADARYDARLASLRKILNEL